MSKAITQTPTVEMEPIMRKEENTPLCPRCDAFIDAAEENIKNYHGAEDLLTQLKRKCDLCGGPDLSWVGPCPNCGRPVEELADGRFVCPNAILNGTCDFIVSMDPLYSIDWLGDLTKDSWNIIEALLFDGAIAIERAWGNDDTTDTLRFRIELVNDEDLGWCVNLKVKDCRAIPRQKIVYVAA
jgi:hypothetical protein